jgi:hypothetical protein
MGINDWKHFHNIKRGKKYFNFFQVDPLKNLDVLMGEYAFQWDGTIR